MNIYEEKLIIVGGERPGEGRRRGGGGDARHLFSFQNSFAGLPQPLRAVPSRPVLQHPTAEREEGFHRLEPHPPPPTQIWWRPLCPSKWQTGSPPALHTPPDSHNCVMEVFLNCNLITILIALNGIMMGNKQEESEGEGVERGEWGVQQLCGASVAAA